MTKQEFDKLTHNLANDPADGAGLPPNILTTGYGYGDIKRRRDDEWEQWAKDNNYHPLAIEAVLAHGWSPRRAEVLNHLVHALARTSL